MDTDFDRLADRFEQELKTGDSPEIAEYLESTPHVARTLMLRELISLEVFYFLKQGQAVSSSRYDRFGPEATEFAAETLEQKNAVIAAAGDHDDTPRVDYRPKDSSAREVPAFIGHYELLERIGEGGMGSVWRAQQHQPIRRTVALKLLKPELVSSEFVSRFEAERQALAMMDHPNIAKVHDAGTTEDGLPYFVMELVNGVPITRHCQQNQLPLDACLQLFVGVCRAAQHAHEKGIVHRDIKPSNVIVTQVDGNAIPKMIDFGLAKATQTTVRLTEETMHTECGKLVGTLQYMSPEQAEMSSQNVDARTDVYALGAMLYELVTGQTPLRKDAIGKSTLLQLLQMIREKEPPKPSLTHGTRLPRELDWVVMKALAKDRELRYPSAMELADDLSNFLAGRPINARPIPNASTPQSHAWSWSLATICAILGFIGLGAWLFWWPVDQTPSEDGHAADLNSSSLDADGHLSNAPKLLEPIRFEYQDVVAYLQANESEKARALLKLIPVEEQSSLEWRLLNRLSKSETKILRGHSDWINDIAFTHQGKRLVSASSDRSLILWETETGRQLATFQGHEGPITSVASSPQGELILSGSFDGTVRVWDQRNGAEVHTLTGHQAWIRGVAIAPNGNTMASSCDDHTIKVWNGETGELLQTFEGHTNAVFGIAFSPDGTRIASASHDRTIKLWEVSSGSVLQTFRGHAMEIGAVAFRPDSKQLVSGSNDSSIRVWNLSTGEEIMQLEGHESTVTCVAFSPDGKRIVSSGNDRQLRLWDAESGRLIMTLNGHDKWVTSLCFSPDGMWLASSSADGAVKLWDARR